MTRKPVLDNRDIIKKLDTDHMYDGVEALYFQIKHAWEETQKLDTTSIHDVANIVVAGMGGSGRGADIIKTALKDRLTVPLDLIHDYTLPGYVNEKTVVILASVSGSTEEIIEATKQAHLKKAQIAIIAGGGELLKLAKEENYLHYELKMEHNPSKQQRIAQGYTIMGMIGLLSVTHLIKLENKEVEEILATVARCSERFALEIPTHTNLAKALAYQIIDRRPVIVVADFLEGIAHTITNQLHENAKIFAQFQVIPEMNHHLLEGLQFPKSNTADHLFLVVQSGLYHPRNQRRIELTTTLIEDNEIETATINLTSSTKLTQAFELLALFNYVSLFVSFLEEINPAPLPGVDWFKENLSKN